MPTICDLPMTSGQATRIALNYPNVFSHASVVGKNATLHIKDGVKAKAAKDAVNDYFRPESRPKITIFNNQLCVLDGVAR